MHLSSPVRIPKLQLAAEQPTTGKCLTPPKKKKGYPTFKGKEEPSTRWEEGRNCL